MSVELDLLAISLAVLLPIIALLFGAEWVITKFSGWAIDKVRAVIKKKKEEDGVQ